jgi:DNA polymerase III subunit delta
MKEAAAILAELRKGNFRPVYFLSGEEPYFIDQISDFIEDYAIDASLRDFNQSVLYGKDVSVQQIITEAKKYPMMGERQVVIVKEAQHIKNIEELDSYISSPLSSTILVVCYKYKTLDKRKSFGKNLGQKAVTLESPKLKDYQVPDWINQYLKEKPYKISQPATILLTEFLGNDLSRIANEISKLMITLPAGSEITPAVIEKYIGISKEFNNFELQKALAVKDVLKCNRIINYFAASPKDNPMVVTISSLFSWINKIILYHYCPDKSEKAVASAIGIHPFIVKEYAQAARLYDIRKSVAVVSYLREYDLKSKGVGSAAVSDGELLKELIYKILH